MKHHAPQISARAHVDSPRRGALFSALALCSGLAAAGCGSDGPPKPAPLGSQRSALTQADQDVLGFEVLNGWTLSQGSKSLSPLHSQGQHALAVTTGGWTEIVSVPLSTLGSSPEAATVDLRLPANQANPWWYGELQLYVSIPSQNIFNEYVGQVELNGKPLEQFLTHSFQLPGFIRTALGKSYTDLTLKLALNAPAGNGAYVFDNLRLGQGNPTPNPGQVTACDAYQQVGRNGDLRFQLTAPPGATNVHVVGKRSGQVFVDKDLVPISTAASGASTYTFVDSAGNYAAGTPVAVQFAYRQPTPQCPLDAVSPWQPGQAYDAAIARVSYRGQTYEAVHAHISRPGTEPGTEGAPWHIPNACRGAGWHANTTYAVDDRVGFQGISYRAVVAHTSQGQFDPTQWLATSDPPNPPGSGTGAIVLRPGPTANEWSEQTYGATLGCVPVSDRDGDREPDATDLCPDDASKTLDLGWCGCDQAEADLDHDHVPDCKDACPDDPLRLVPGDCGCANAFAPSGRFCDDSGVPGAFKCDAAGHCGATTPPRPAFATGPCALSQFGDSLYISCTASSDKVTWAEAASQAPPGYQLARVDSEAEHRLLSSIVTGMGSGASVWLDGLVTGPGVVSHTKPPGSPVAVFWDESAGPKNTDSAFFKWDAGQPAPGVGSGCESLGSSGGWQLGSCTDRRSAVYERSSRTLTPLTTAAPITVADFPGLVSGPTLPPGSEPCVDTSAGDQACRDCVEDFPDDETACLAECRERRCTQCIKTGVDPSTCSDCTPCERCQVVHEADPAACDGICGTSQGVACTSPFAAYCKVQVADPANPLPCTLVPCGDGTVTCPPAYTCPAGLTCGVFNRLDCGECGEDSHPCPAGCSMLACGTKQNKDCGLEEDSVPCREELTCSRPEELGNPDPQGGLTPLTQPGVPSFGDTNTQPPAEPSVAKYPDADADTAGPSLAKAWCTYDSGAALAPKRISDEKQGGAGSGKVLQFDLDPNVTLDYQLNPLALGQVKFGIDAQAQLKASAAINFATINTSFDILDAKLAAHADRCGYGTSGSYLQLFGRDFLPAILESQGQEGLLVDHELDGCKAALDAYIELANRVKKAMRDAQELLRQYHQAIQDGVCFDAAALCQQLLDKAPTGFVTVDCSNVKVEDVINLFIFNYQRQLLGNVPLPPLAGAPRVSLPDFPDFRLKNPSFGAQGINFDDFSKLGALPSLSEAGKALATFNPATGKLKAEWADEYGCGPRATTERRTLFTKPFTLGPIPMLLEVESVLKYGLNGDVKFDFQPDNLVALATGGAAKEVPLASVTANATPCVSAGIGLFVGAGFKGFGFRATAGVEGVVNLGTISAPAEATASIKMSAEDEALGLTAKPSFKNGDANASVTTVREISDDLKGLWDESAPPIKQRRFKVRLGYTYGLSVALNQILAGHLKAALQIKFLWIRKRWSKYLVNFGEGISLGEHKLIGGDGNVALEAALDWGTLQAPSPFVKLRYLEPLPNGFIGAAAGALPNFDIGVGKLGNLGWSSPRLRDITLSPEDLSSLGGLASALEAAGIDLGNLELSDLARLGITLDRLTGVPLTVGDLAALDLSVADLARLGIELPQLATDRLDLAGVSVAHLGVLGLTPERLGKLEFDWRDLPELAYLLRRVELPQALRDAGADLSNLTMPDFQRIGLPIDRFRGWPLTGQNVEALRLTSAELGRLGVDLSGLDLNIDGDPASFLERGLDLSGLSLASLAQLGLSLGDLNEIAVDSARLLELNTALGYTDIRTALAAAGVDLEHITLADLGKLGAQLDTLTGKLSSADLGLNASDLIKLGLGHELSQLPSIGPGCTPTAAIATDRVGQFFYERQCECRPAFDAALPYTKGEQSCTVDADCCAAAPHCSATRQPGFKVCSATATGTCGPTAVVLADVTNSARAANCPTKVGNVCTPADFEEVTIDRQFGSKICGYRVFLESRDATAASMDDRGFVVDTLTGLSKKVTDDPICGQGRTGLLPGPTDVTDYVRLTAGNKLRLKLRSEDVCGTSLGWANLRLRYEVSYAP